MSERHDQRAGEQRQRVGDRWTTTGKADAVKANEGHQQAAPIPDAAKPTLSPYARRSPWWAWT